MKTGLPTLVFKFFSTQEQLEQKAETIKPRSISDFNAAYPNISIKDVDMICKKFVALGYMEFWGQNNQFLFFGNCYLSTYQEEFAQYGTYDFLTQGFLSVRNYFQQSVKPVIVINKVGKDDIGTCFLLTVGDNKNYIITALHCIENMNKVLIESEKGEPIKPKNIFISNDTNKDIAIIECNSNFFPTTPHFKFAQGSNILDEILMMGYPPLTGFDALLISEKASINTILKSSSGNYIANGKSYLDKQEYILINAKVKGGNSGGPIINNTGGIVGMLVQISANPEKPDELDILGYGIGIPSMTIMKLIQSILSNDTDNYKKLKFNNTSKGFSTYH